jgi:hypothetical protein
MKSRLLAATAALSFLATPAFADDINVGKQLWGSIQATAPLGDDWSASVDFQPRFTSDNAATAPVTIIPPVISYRVDDNLIVSGGYLYAYIDGDQVPSGFAENRFFQAASYRLGTIGKVGFRASTRVEQRQRTIGKDWNVRVAQQLLAALPLSEKPGGVTMVASVELYLNLNETDWGARKGYDDLWSFVGFQVPLREDVAMEVGYLNQRQRAVLGNANMNHAAVVGISFQLPRRVRPPKVVPTVGPAARQRPPLRPNLPGSFP